MTCAVQISDERGHLWPLPEAFCCRKHDYWRVRESEAGIRRSHGNSGQWPQDRSSGSGATGTGIGRLQAIPTVCQTVSYRAIFFYKFVVIPPTWGPLRVSLSSSVRPSVCLSHLGTSVGNEKDAGNSELAGMKTMARVTTPYIAAWP